MTTTLVTGGNKGLGHETARQLIAAGHTVYIGARDPGRGRQAADRLGARLVQLNVTDDASVTAAVEKIAGEGGLDVLVNNAGVEVRRPDNGVVPTTEITAEGMRKVFETNVFGVVRVTHAFVPLLQKSTSPVVVNVSSALGSLAHVSDPEQPAHMFPGLEYPASKLVVNMITVQYAKGFPKMRINAVDPGFTKTDLNGNTGVQTLEQGAAVIVRMALIDSDGPTGGYFDIDGPLPW
jgi:NAD(P)-dependent dehydrogenase (short-subunit alcohol dehydrogenase family)